MKIAFKVFIGIIVILTFSNFKLIPHVPGEDSFIEIYFSNKLEFNDLVKIKLDLSEKGIMLNYKMLQFNDEGKLISLEYKVTADKVGGSDKTEKFTEDIGFIINTSAKPKYGIIVGTKSQVQTRRKELEKKNSN